MATGREQPKGLPTFGWLDDERRTIDDIDREIKRQEILTRRLYERSTDNACPTDGEECVPERLSPLATSTPISTRRPQAVSQNSPDGRPYANKPPRAIDLPSFTGSKNESINRFIDRFEKTLIQQRTHPSDWEVTLTTCLRDCASDFIDRRHITGYENMIQALRDKYRPTYLDVDALTDEKQSVNETATQYGARLRSIPAMDSIDEREKLRIFQRGLRPSIRSSIMLFEPKSFDEAMQKADHAERLQPVTLSNAIVHTTTSSTPVHKPAPDVNTLVTTAVQSAVKQAIRPMQKQLRKTVYNAQESSQVTPPWRQRPQGYQQRDNFKNNYPKRQDTERKCWECGSPTHIRRNCYRYINNNNRGDNAGRRFNKTIQNGRKPFNQRKPFQQGRYSSRPRRNNSGN